ncbi:unnamed protein product [Amoebophrya sp. A25]|nr:unnamed protein product [Amoebophrya sp. A25]|eukprot:GSA25T00003809001.1
MRSSLLRIFCRRPPLTFVERKRLKYHDAGIVSPTCYASKKVDKLDLSSKNNDKSVVENNANREPVQPEERFPSFVRNLFDKLKSFLKMVTADPGSSLKRPLEAVANSQGAPGEKEDADAKRQKKPVQLEDLGGTTGANGASSCGSPDSAQKVKPGGSSSSISNLLADAKSAVQSLRDGLVPATSAVAQQAGTSSSSSSSTKLTALDMMNLGKAVKATNTGTGGAGGTDGVGATGSANAGTGPLSYWEDFRRAERAFKTIAQSTSSATSSSKSKEIIVKDHLASTSFHPKVFTNFDPDKPLPFQLIADGLTLIEEKIGSGKGSNKMKIVVLTNVFRTILYKRKSDLLFAVYFLLSKVGADYEGLEVGVGDSLVFKAVSTSFSSSQSAIQDLITRSEAQDIGEAALILKMKTRQIMTPARLTIAKVFTEIRDKIAKAEGKNSQKQKTETMQKLIAATQRDEVKYLVRSFQAKLRVGINNATILVALAHAIVFADCSDSRTGGPEFGSDLELEARLQAMETAVKRAYCECPNYERIINALTSPPQPAPDATSGEAGGAPGAALGVPTTSSFTHNYITPERLNKMCKITPGIPLKPMLAKPSKGIHEVLERLANTKFTAEYKYDGERAQVHVYKTKSGKIEYRVYSRNSENMTPKYPDVIEIVKKNLGDGVTSLIVDAEVVAYEPATKTIQPFQKLSTRSKKNVKIEDIKVQVCLFVFDLIFLNGKPWTGKTLRERRDKLQSALKHSEGTLHFAEGKDMELVEEDIQNYLNEAVGGSCEGLMLKTLDDNATYEPSKRSLNWLKLKKDYMQGMGDSVDVVPIGAWFGTGKRTGTFGSYLLACYNPDTDEFQTLCKAGTGYSDEALKQHHDFFKDKTRTSPESNIVWTESPHIKPDVWLEICQVWEVKAADLSISPVHCAAIGLAHPEKGIALRFPRFIRVRDDKNVDDATTAEQIRQMYDSQSVIASGGTAGADDGGDDFL